MNTLGKLIAFPLTLLLSLFGSLAHAADYPTKPITLVVPFAPGGFVHTVALMFSEGMSGPLGQSVVVVNRPGANGNLAAASVASAAPDGYTIFLPTASILTINPHLYKNIQFNPLRDFASIGQIANTSNLFVVNANSDIKSFKDLVDRARAKPGTVSYGSSGSGSIQHIAGEALARQAGVKLLHVPYKGIGPAVNDVLGDRLTFVFSDASAIPHVKGGRLTALAVSPRKLAELPDVPALADTVAAAGVPQYSPPAIWYGLVAPKGTPPEIIARLNAAMVQTLKRPEVHEKLLASGAAPVDDPTSEQFARVIEADHARYAELLKTLDITVE